MSEDLKNFVNKFTKLRETFKKKLGTGNLKKIGNTLVVDIKKRITDGYGVEQNGHSKQKFKPLKASTIAKRAHYKRLSSKTSPSKSNQTFSGTFVKSIRANVSKGKIEIGPGKKRQEVAAIQEEKGRPSIYLSKEEKKKLENIISDILDEALKDL